MRPTPCGCTSALFSDLHRTAVDTATLQLSLRGPILFCLARKEWGEKRRWRRVILRAHARDFLAAPRPERPLRAQNCDDSDGFRFGKCTTRICGQTASISVLLISGILDRLWSCTAPCRGRCPHRPFSGFCQTSSIAATPQLCLRRPILFCLARKEWGEKRRWMRIGLYCKPQNHPIEEGCGQHTIFFLQI